jgi:hypothetical protein
MICLECAWLVERQLQEVIEEVISIKGDVFCLTETKKVRTRSGNQKEKASPYFYGRTQLQRLSFGTRKQRVNERRLPI